MVEGKIDHIVVQRAGPRSEQWLCPQSHRYPSARLLAPSLRDLSSPSVSGVEVPILSKDGHWRAGLLPVEEEVRWYRYCRGEQAVLRIRTRDLARARVSYGYRYRRLHILLQREGWEVNQCRLYKQEGLDDEPQESQESVYRRERITASRVNENWFLSLEDAREKVEEWRQDYNKERPHGSIDNLAAREYLAAQEAIS